MSKIKQQRMVVYFVHDARTYREKAGKRIKAIEAASNLSRSTIGRIEADSGVSRVSAYAYLNALRELVPSYPYSEAFTHPKGAQVEEVKLDRRMVE